MKKLNKYSLLLLLTIPTIVYAEFDTETLLGVIFVELFCTIHMSLFVLIPIANLIDSENSRAVFKKLILGRVAALAMLDMFIPEIAAGLDFFLIFIGAFLVVPIWAGVTKKQPFDLTLRPAKNPTTTTPTTITTGPSSILNTLGITNETTEATQAAPEVVKTNILKITDFDPMYQTTEKTLIETVIKKEMANAGLENNAMPADVLRRRTILNIIFSVLLFIYVCLIFFHFPIYTYVIGAIILFIFSRMSKKFDLMEYIKKELQTRPGEKISNIIMTIKTNTVDSRNSKIIKLVCVLIAIVVPCIIFIQPRILYEEVDGGYAVRFYAFGIKNFTSATIPETYNGKPVVSLRGNTFSSMFFLKEVNLPDTIIEIRGQAFENCKALVKVNLPKKLEYLGGGAFRNCTSLKEAILPDTLTFLGGESFYGASSLRNVVLSENLTEIRGDSFEYCTSLETITIPDNITRIGGHAFYGDTRLSKVDISQKSKLVEIGSSAFRMCSSLREIYIPAGTSVNERAFKESPTQVRRYGDYGYNIPNDNYELGSAEYYN